MLSNPQVLKYGFYGIKNIMYVLGLGLVYKLLRDSLMKFVDSDTLFK